LSLPVWDINSSHIRHALESGEGVILEEGVDRSNTSRVDADLQFILVRDLNKLDVFGEHLGDVGAEVGELLTLHALWHKWSGHLFLIESL
jgi:hypothetical protein